MAQQFSNDAKAIMLDALTADRVSLHTGDPGGSGTANEVTGGGYARQPATFNAASGNNRALASDVEFSGPAAEDATWFAVWEEDGAAGPTDLFLGRGPITGDQAFNAGGQFILGAGSTLSITDPT